MRNRRLMIVASAATGLLALAALPRGVAAETTSATYVYFDQTEEEDVYVDPSGTSVQQLIPPWDANGQLCVFPDRSGRFAVGYNPTGASQKEVGPGRFKPRKSPPVGEAVYDQHGNFTGQTLYVPGPDGFPGQAPTGDVPPDSTGSYNNDGTMTGCTFDARGNLFAVDLATAQGNYPPDDDGRLIEWFAPDYGKVCIVYGPTTGSNLHHVDGHGGLQQPGLMAHDDAGNIYVTVDEADPTTLQPRGKVLRFAATELPPTSAQCPGSNGDQANYHVAVPTTFIDAATFGLPFPQGIARDPVCKCWAVDSVFLSANAVEWFDDNGQPVSPSLHLPISAVSGPPSNPQLNPLGLAFDPQGDLFLMDLRIGVNAGSITSGGFSVGAQDAAGRVLRFSFTGPVANAPSQVFSGGYYSLSITTCVPRQELCPFPMTASSPAVPGATPAAQPGTTGSVQGLPSTAAWRDGGRIEALGAALLAALSVAARRRRRDQYPVSDVRRVDRGG